MDLKAMINDLCGIGKKRYRIESPDELERKLVAKFGRVTRTQGHNGLEFIVDCPVCGRHKLTVNSVSGIYKCWRGCTSGMVGKLLGGLKMTTTAVQAVERRSSEYYPPGELVSLRTLGDDSPARVYLRTRGFDADEMSNVFGLEYCGFGKSFAGGRFSATNTLVVPVVRDGVRIGWQCRLLYDPDKVEERNYGMMGFLYEDGKWHKPPKYFTMPGMDKGKILWNYDNASGSDVVVVTEGVFDAARVGKCGVATFGKSVSDAQIAMLQRWKLVVLLLDPDAENEAEALKLRFPMSANVLDVRLHGYKDAGEAPRKEVWEQILSAAESAGVDMGAYKIIV